MSSWSHTYTDDSGVAWKRTYTKEVTDKGIEVTVMVDEELLFDDRVVDEFK